MSKSKIKSYNGKINTNVHNNKRKFFPQKKVLSLFVYQ